MLVKWIRCCLFRIFTVRVFCNISRKTRMDFAVFLKLSETLKPAERLVHFYKCSTFAKKDFNCKAISSFLMFLKIILEKSWFFLKCKRYPSMFINLTILKYLPCNKFKSKTSLCFQYRFETWIMFMFSLRRVWHDFACLLRTVFFAERQAL